MIKAVIFDIGGVLRNNINIKGFWQDKKESKKLRYGFGIGKVTIKQFIKKASKLLGLSEKDFLKEYEKAYGKLKLKKQVFEILKKIKIKKYILSDTNPLHTSYEKKRYGYIFKYVNGVFLSHKIGMRKNKVSAFKYVIKRIKINPKETIMIDDEPNNLKNARKLGIKTILFKNAWQLKKDLKKFEINI